MARKTGVERDSSSMCVALAGSPVGSAQKHNMVPVFGSLSRVGCWTLLSPHVPVGGLVTPVSFGTLNVSACHWVIWASVCLPRSTLLEQFRVYKEDRIR